MLRFAEEILLLMLDDETGKFLPVPELSVQYALAGSVLMDLALENRIDTDTEILTLVDKTPTGDELLDPTLNDIAEVGEGHNAQFWVDRTSSNAEEIRDKALNRLVERGVLERQEDRLLWVFKTRRYPMIDGKVEREVKLRIMEVLFSDQLPDPRDIVIISLCSVCGIFDQLFAAHELETITPRIKQVRKLDLIGQAMTRAVRDIEATIAATAAFPRM